MTFNELKLLPQLLRAVEELGYVQPSPIQAEAIPPVLKGRDLIGCAQTGTGKTAAFAIPILQRLNGRVNKKHTPIRALVLTPTRELALQIKESFDQYGKYLNIRHTVIFGGVGQGPQVEALERGVDVLVATPGRLNDLCNQGHIRLDGIETFVLDEADRMLDMGFIHDVRKVIARLPERRQTLLFSATMPQESLDSVLVFTNTKHGADRVVKELGRAGVAAMAIHGNKGQTARIRALDSFKSGAIRVLVATDIAARGIDVNELAAVVNYELPNVPETYVHRIGRTGRAGRSGVAISFCNFDELAYLKDIEKVTGRKVPVVENHPWPMEILEASPKKQPGQRPPRAERARGRQAVPEGPVPVRLEKRPQKPAVGPEQRAPLERPAIRPERASLRPAAPAAPVPPPPQPAVRKISSEPPRMGRLVAFADGRRSRRKRPQGR